MLPQQRRVAADSSNGNGSAQYFFAEVNSMSNPYAPSAGGPGMGGPPPDLIKKAGSMQTMGILSIVFAFCCGLVTIILSIMVLAQAGGVIAQIRQYGGSEDLIKKVNTGKTCAIIGLVILAAAVVLSVVVNLAGLANQ
jgi:hypothetical protein